MLCYNYIWKQCIITVTVVNGSGYKHKSNYMTFYKMPPIDKPTDTTNITSTTTTTVSTTATPRLDVNTTGSTLVCMYVGTCVYLLYWSSFLLYIAMYAWKLYTIGNNSSRSSNTSNTVMIAGIAGGSFAVILVIIILIVVFILVCRRRKGNVEYIIIDYCVMNIHVHT